MRVRNLILIWLAKYSKRYRTKLLLNIRKELNTVKHNFSKATVKYNNNLELLVTITNNIDYVHEEDLSAFHNYDITTYTTSSSSVVELIGYYLSNGYSNRPINNLRAMGSKQVAYLDWYSNLDDIIYFLEGMRELLLTYLVVNPTGNSPLEVLDWERHIPLHLENFLNDKDFKLLVLDYINLLILMLEIELNNLN